MLPLQDSGSGGQALDQLRELSHAPLRPPHRPQDGIRPLLGRPGTRGDFVQAVGPRWTAGPSRFPEGRDQQVTSS